jgi:hypothetical protein
MLLGSFGRTLTLHETEKDPEVVGLKALGDRRPMKFATFRSGAIRLGRGEDCHIRACDRHVSELQCFLFRRGRNWLLTQHPRAKNPTFVDAVEAKGDTTLHVGSFVRAGSSIWLCVADDDGTGEWRVTAGNHQEFLQSVLLAYGSGNAGAQAVGIHPNTFRRRIQSDVQGAEIFSIIEAIRRSESEFKIAQKRRGYCSPVGYPIIGAEIRAGVVLEPLKLFSAHERLCDTNEDAIHGGVVSAELKL